MGFSRSDVAAVECFWPNDKNGGEMSAFAAAAIAAGSG
jgi:hypothetical protein